jgi:hypothetical protein
MRDVGIFYVNLVYFVAVWHISKLFGIFFSFGMLYQEKSGNPASFERIPKQNLSSKQFSTTWPSQWRHSKLGVASFVRLFHIFLFETEVLFNSLLYNFHIQYFFKRFREFRTTVNTRGSKMAFFSSFSTGISDTVPHRFLLRADSNTTMITWHHHHHLPTLSLEHPSLSLKLPT